MADDSDLSQNLNYYTNFRLFHFYFINSVCFVSIVSFACVFPVCCLCANQSTLDCMQVPLDLLGPKYPYVTVVRSKPNLAYYFNKTCKLMIRSVKLPCMENF